MKLYFAYGANLHLDNMRWRCPDAVPIQPFYLKGYRLAFSGVATILPEERSQVPGALWAISDHDEKSLDGFEGFPTMYRKEIIEQDGMEFMVYIMNSTEPWEPGANYLATISEGYDNWHLPQEDLIEAIERTLEEINDYDLQWSTTDRTRLDPYMEKPVRGQSSNDLRWIRNLRLAD